MHRAGLMLMGALALAGCASTQPFIAEAPRQVPVADSMVTLWPGAGALRGVVETQYVNAIEQKVSIDTGRRGQGESYIKVQYFKTEAKKVVQGGLQDVQLATMDMAGEARGTVNWADMKLSPYFVQNAYGPFGYSMGRTATGDICMYAWQRIPPPRVASMSEWKTVNVRVLVCAYGKTEREILETMMQLHLKGVAGKGQPAPGDIGAYGMVISPYASGPADILPPIVTTPVATTPKPAPPPAPVVDTPGPVPSPPGSGSIPGPGGTGGGTVPGPGATTPAPIVPGPN
ncbi:MAG: cellulose biosynthesis protein BcsN [Devosia sp.]